MTSIITIKNSKYHAKSFQCEMKQIKKMRERYPYQVLWFGWFLLNSLAWYSRTQTPPEMSILFLSSWGWTALTIILNFVVGHRSSDSKTVCARSKPTSICPESWIVIQPEVIGPIAPYNRRLPVVCACAIHRWGCTSTSTLTNYCSWGKHELGQANYINLIV